MFSFYDVIEIIYRWSGIKIDTREYIRICKCALKMCKLYIYVQETKNILFVTWQLRVNLNYS